MSKILIIQLKIGMDRKEKGKYEKEKEAVKWANEVEQ